MRFNNDVLQNQVFYCCKTLFLICNVFGNMAYMLFCVLLCLRREGAWGEGKALTCFRGEEKGTFCIF